MFLVYNRWPVLEWAKWQDIIFFLISFLAAWLLIVALGLPINLIERKDPNDRPIPPTPITAFVFYISMFYVLVAVEILSVNPWHAYILSGLFLFSFAMARYVLDGHPKQLPPGKWFNFIRPIHSWTKKHCKSRDIFGLLPLLFGRYLFMVPLAVVWVAWSFQDSQNWDAANILNVAAHLSVVVFLWLFFMIAYRFLLLGHYQRPNGPRFSEGQNKRLVTRYFDRATGHFNLLPNFTVCATLLVFLLWIIVVVYFGGSVPAIIQHLMFPTIATGVLLYGVYVLYGNVKEIKSGKLKLRNLRPTARFYCLFLVPFFGAWIGTSLVDTYQRGFRPEGFLAAKSPHRGPGRENQQLSGKSDDDPEIWLMLSGGGYRAAAIHTGVLTGLEEMGRRPRLISSVSGGSIVGAFYAAGGTTEQFTRILENGNDFIHQLLTSDDSPKLGLWDYIFHVYNFSKTLLPGVSRTDIYTTFFKQTYFGLRMLSSVSNSHILINTTDLDQQKRVVFYGFDGPDPVPSTTGGVLYGGTAGDLEIGRAVAASGAFPGAFRPLILTEPEFHVNDPELKVPKDKERNKLYQRRLIDGGVIENLGLDGLEIAYGDDNLRSYLSSPSILIVSDASKEGNDLGDQEPTSAKIAGAALNIQSQRNHERLMERVLCKDSPRYAYDTPFVADVCPTWLGTESNQAKLILLDPTSKKGSDKIWENISSSNDVCPDLKHRIGSPFNKDSLTELVKRVSAISTLKDVSRTEAKEAIALGKCSIEIWKAKLS